MILQNNQQSQFKNLLKKNQNLLKLQSQLKSLRKVLKNWKRIKSFMMIQMNLMMRTKM